MASASPSAFSVSAESGRTVSRGHLWRRGEDPHQDERTAPSISRDMKMILSSFNGLVRACDQRDRGEGDPNPGRVAKKVGPGVIGTFRSDRLSVSRDQDSARRPRFRGGRGRGTERKSSSVPPGDHRGRQSEPTRLKLVRCLKMAEAASAVRASPASCDQLFGLQRYSTLSSTHPRGATKVLLRSVADHR
jgi:hypothetical protein